MQSIVLALLATVAAATSDVLMPEKVPVQCRLLSASGVLLRNQPLGLYFCEAGDSNFVLAAEQQQIDIAFDKEVLQKLRAGELIRHKRQFFGSGFGGASSNSQSSSFSGGGGGFGSPGFGGGGFGPSAGFGGGIAGSSAQAGSFAGGAGGGSFYG